MTPEREEVVRETGKKTPSAEAISYALEARGIEGWFEVSLEDGRRVAVAAYCLLWEDLPLPDSLDLTEVETWCSFCKSLEERGMNDAFVFFVFLGEEEKSGKIVSGSFDNSPYSDKETVEFLKALGKEHEWGFDIDKVIPDDVALALVETLNLEEWGI